MSKTVFDLSLKLLPRHRRERYGDEMREVFAALAADVRRNAGTTAARVLLMKEVGGVMRFAIRERLERLRDWRPAGGGWHPVREVHWAWRGVRTRGWRAAFVVGLFGIVLAANTIVFSVTDALVLNTLPYREPERLVRLRMANHPQLLELRAQQDLLEAVHGYLPGSTYLLGEREPLDVETTFVTPGLLRMLGSHPQFGRGFIDNDIAATEPPVAIISSDLARERFGRAEAAVGRRLETDDRELLVIGVMRAGFRFPDGRTRLWRVLDHARYAGRGVIVSGFPGFWPIARLAPGVPRADAERTLVERIPAFAPRGNAPALQAVAFGRPTDDRRRRMFALLGAALCLLLTAAANVANVELAGTLRRARVYAIQSALGASRATLLRTTLLEGGMVVLISTAVAFVLAWLTLDVVASHLPERFTAGGVNPIDLNWRSGAFMAVAALAAWIAPSVPLLLSTVRLPLVQTLQSDSRVAAASRTSTIFRGLLTVGQVSLAVILLVGGLLFARTYASLLSVDRGVDTTNLASISVGLPAGLFPTPQQVDDLAATVVTRLRAHQDVVSATRLLGPAPPATGFAMGARLVIDGQAAGDAERTAVIYDVEPAFFETLGLPVRAGRTFVPTDPPTSVVISESMARRFWPGRNPVGRTFEISRSYPLYTVIGVVPHVRNTRDDLAGPSDATFVFYRPAPKQTPASGVVQRGLPPGELPANVPAAARGRRLTFLVRLRDASRLAAVEQLLRGNDTRAQVRAELLDDQYARRHSETLMATSIVAAFAALAVVVTGAGVYGVMAFLVASRTREIGVRMALGATRGAVHHLVFSSALRWVGAGAAIGLCGAAVSSQWIESQLFGVSTVDPLTYVGVAVLIVVMAVLATWLPARRAAGVDPAVTLRAE